LKPSSEQVNIQQVKEVFRGHPGACTFCPAGIRFDWDPADKAVLMTMGYLPADYLLQFVNEAVKETG